MTGYPSIDRPWLRYYTEQDITSAPAECSVFENIYRNNKDYPDEIAFIYFGLKITYRKLFNEIDSVSKALAATGVKADENVVLCTPAIPEAMYLILALNRIGANAVMLNPTFTREQLIARTKETNARLLFVLDELYKVMKDVIPETDIQTVISCPAVNSLGALVKLMKNTNKIRPQNTVQWNDFVKAAKNQAVPPMAEYIADRPAIMVYSSGTTGASKGIQLTNGSISNTVNEGEKIGFDWKRQDRYLAQVPIWFSTGICATIIVPLTYGITVILEPMYDFEIFYDHISKYHPNFMITAAGLLDYLMTKREIDPAYKEFKFLVIGGEYVTPHAEKRFNEWLKKNGCPYELFKGYGMCELGGTVTASSPKCNDIGSAGKPTPHVVISAFDLNTGKELPYGERGEIRVSSPCHMKEYYKNPEATARYFRTDEYGTVWGCTGDMGYVSENGSVYVSGRLSDSYINEDGETIYLFDIERAVLDIPEVRQCKAVVSEIDGIPKHVCHLAINRGEDYEKTMEKIMAHCSEKLTESAMPHLFRIYDDSLPVSPSGKLDIKKMQADITGLRKA